MTEEDAKRVTTVGAKELYHLSCKGLKLETKIATKSLAFAVGAAYKKFDSRTRVYQGDQALKKFIKFDKNNKGPIGKIDVNETDFKEFAKTCKKNGVDFAIVKDKVDPETVHFFFAGKNAETMSYLFEDYAKNKFQQDVKKDIIPEEKDKEAEMKKEIDDVKINPIKKHEKADLDLKPGKENIRIDLDEELDAFELPERTR